MQDKYKQEAANMNGETLDVAEQRKLELQQLFPSAFTEAVNEKGELVSSIDFGQLKAELGEFSDVFESRREKYGMDWPGKRDALRLVQEPSRATLKPCREESVNFDNTENLFIEGDNLEVLKLLQKSYYGKIKMIYIDPPYNTGKEFIYPDKYSESLDTYLSYAGLIDNEGRKFTTNAATEGRFHTKWLNMMYPRLYLARNLLRDDGVIFISIDDNEYVNLANLCYEIFGNENLISTFIWKKKAGGGDDSGHVAVEHEYVLCFGKDISNTSLSNIKHESPSMTAKYNREENGRRYYLERLDKTSLTYSQSMDFEIECPDGTFVKPPQPNPNKPTSAWRWGKSTVKDRSTELEFVKDKKTGDWRIYTRTWESLDGVTPRSLLVDKDHGRNREGTRELSDLLGPKEFSNPKPTKFLQHLINIGSSQDNDIILDFFSGSGSLTHAVYLQNTNDDIQRKVISVQLPEIIEGGRFKTIAEIGKERIFQAGKKIKESVTDYQGDVGFKVFKLYQSNFKQWQAPKRSASDDDLIHQMELHIDHLKDDSDPEAILYELLLKAGFMPTEKVEVLSFFGKNVYSIANGALLIYLEDQIESDLIQAIADAEPTQFICLDKAFGGNDQLKANAVQTFMALNQSREMKIEFRTV